MMSSDLAEDAIDIHGGESEHAGLIAASGPSAPASSARPGRNAGGGGGGRGYRDVPMDDGEGGEDGEDGGGGGRRGGRSGSDGSSDGHFEDDDAMLTGDGVDDLDRPKAAAGAHGPYEYPTHPDVDDLACVPDLPCGTYRRMGKLYVCATEERGLDGGRLGGPRATPTWVVGPCWPMLVLTNCLIVGVTALAMVTYLPYVHWVFGVFGVGLLAFVVFALAKTACTNPGVLPRHAGPDPPERNWRWSEQAQSYYPPGVTYCTESQVLVRDYDHFCPWTGTLIARDNFCCFTNFTGCLMFACLGVGAILVFGLMQISAQDTGRT